MQDPNYPNQYYKDPSSGVEMEFKFYTDYGWTVCFPNIEYIKDFTASIPFPETPEEYKESVKKYYEALDKMMGRSK